MTPQINAQDAPKETTDHFIHAHSKRFYPWGLYSDFVYHPDPYGEKISAGLEEEDVELSPLQGLVIKGSILMMLAVIAWIVIAL